MIITFENCLISFPLSLLFGQVGSLLKFSNMSFPHNVLVQIFGEGNSVELLWVDFEDDDIIPIQYQPHHNDGKCLTQLCVETKLVMMVATKIRQSLCIVQ